MPHDNYGIDYGAGSTNVDRATGIRFGVIPMNDLSEWAWDSVEADYGPPTCPHCGNELSEYDDDMHGEYSTRDGARGCDFACETCELGVDGDDAYGDEPIGWTLDDDGYQGTVDSHNDLFLLRSPFYTHAQYCSPCAPGACHLSNPVDDDGPRAYCLSHDWFQDGVAPYAVYRVDNGQRVLPDLDTFTKAYIDALLFSETCDPYGECPLCGQTATLCRWGDGGAPVCADCPGCEPHYSPPADDNCTVNDIAPEALATIVRDCKRFQTEQRDSLERACAKHTAADAISYAGHDFALTRNQHGAGFWDGDWPEPEATALTNAAHAFGEQSLYAGDDGRLYVS